MNLAHVLADGAARHPERTALLFEGERISYRELDRRAAVTAAALRARGVEAHDRVAIKLPNTPDYVAAYFGVLRLGAIAVPLNILLAQPEIDARLEAATPKAFVDRPLPGDGAPHVEITERDEDDPAALLFAAPVLQHIDHRLKRHLARRVGSGPLGGVPGVEFSHPLFVHSLPCGPIPRARRRSRKSASPR